MFSDHFTVATDCKACLSEIDADNYVLYMDNPDADWKSCGYCVECVEHILAEGWKSFYHQVVAADCLAALSRLLSKPPPINFRDTLAVPCDNPTGEVYQFLFRGAPQSAKLDGSLTGVERDQWFNEMKERLELFRTLEKM